MENLQDQNQQNNFSQLSQHNPKKQIPSWIGFVIIAVFVLVIFGGVFAYQYFTIKSQQNSEFFVSRLKTDQTQTQTAGWKTYTNNEYSFEIKYPENYFPNIDNRQQEADYIFTGKVNELIRSEDYDPVNDIYLANIRIAYSGTDVNSWMSKETDYSNNFGHPVPQFKNIVVGGRQSYRYENWASNMATACKSENVIIPMSSGKNTLSIIIARCARDGVEKETLLTENDVKVFNQMLSTFKFLNPVISQKIDSSFLAGKTYDYFCASGEWGTFKNDGSIVVNHGTSQGDDPVSPIVAKWEFKNDQLTISSANKLISSAKNFKLYNFLGNTFAVSEGNGCDSMIIGPDSIKNEEFYNSAPSEYFEAGANLTSDQIFQEVSAWQGFHSKLSYFRIFGQDRVQFSLAVNGGTNFAYKIGGKWYLAGKGGHQDLANCSEYSSVPTQYNPGCIDTATGQAKYIDSNGQSVNYPPSQMVSYIGE